MKTCKFCGGYRCKIQSPIGTFVGYGLSPKQARQQAYAQSKSFYQVCNALV